MASPSIAGVPLKLVSLVSLTVQNSLLTILLHYSRNTPDCERYSAPAAVLLNELLKCLISFAIANFNSCQAALRSRSGSLPCPDQFPSERKSERYNSSETDNAFAPLLGHSHSRRTSTQSLLLAQLKTNSAAIFSRDCWKLSIPAVLYVIQNNLQFVAATHLDVATFSVTYQLKILTTALCSVLILGRKLSTAKWISLLFLALGVALVQLQSVAPTAAESLASGQNRLVGFAAVSLACFTSGLAGVYFELVLKSSNKVDLWIRNVQLSLFSLIPALFGALAAASSQPMFAHFGGWAWATVLTQVFGGLVTALVIKFADNILKGFATSLSIVLSTLAGIVLFGTPLQPGSALGASVVLMSTYCYNQAPTEPATPLLAKLLPFWSDSNLDKPPSGVVIEVLPSYDPYQAHEKAAEAFENDSRSPSDQGLSLQVISQPHRERHPPSSRGSLTLAHARVGSKDSEADSEATRM